MYTSEVLAVVMQQLMEQSPLPMLLMRTVIQSLTMYPRLGGFVMNILARLIMKQVTAGGQSSGTWKAGPISEGPVLLVVFPRHALQLTFPTWRTAGDMRGVCASLSHSWALQGTAQLKAPVFEETSIRMSW